MNCRKSFPLQPILCGVAALVLISAIAPPASTQGKEPTGTMFFINGGSPNNMWSVNADGSNRTLFGYYAYFQYPSRVLHGGHRYFITVKQIPGSLYPDGVTVRREVFAYRDDFNSTTNNNGYTKVQLTDSPTLEPVDTWFNGMHWLNGDQTISFKARRWFGATVVDGGVYTADLTFRADGTISGVAAQPDAPVMAFPLDGNGWPALGNHSWNPNATKLVYTGSGLWVGDLTSGTRTKIYTGAADYPDWSPDGTRIAFSLDGFIMTIRPDGSTVRTVLKKQSPWTGFGHPYYSADGAYIICAGTYTGGNGNAELVRVSSGGGPLTNVTKTLDVGETPIAWR